jgi:hypothetical protein
VGLSGDLKKPSRSIPVGTMTATLAGFVIYAAIVCKLAVSAPPELLASDQLVMARIAIWGPIIYIGLACATLSSAIGSILVAPRTLQALAKDGAFPSRGLNRVFARGVGVANEPRTATIFTGAVALVIVALGNVDLVARLISMFFMVTYGALCTISFLEHFAASPGYRPTFRSRWYVSLLGAVMCVLMMFQMDPVYALLSIGAMFGLYWLTRYTHAGAGDTDVADLFRGVMGQATRWMRIRLHGSRQAGGTWRPSILALGERSFDQRGGALRLLSWLCAKQGFGTYLHLTRGRLSRESYRASEKLRHQLARSSNTYGGVFVDVVVSPSMRTALAQGIQIPGVSGMENNTVLLEFRPNDDPGQLDELVDDALFAYAMDKNILLYRNGEERGTPRRKLHVWLTWHDAENATLMMLLLSYILLGHPEWRKAEIQVFAAFPSSEVNEQRRLFQALIAEGRLPVSQHNIRFQSVDDGAAYYELVEHSSSYADLVILGITEERLREKGVELILRHPSLRQVLFVIADQHIAIE